jgi:hypothetical protein
MMFRRKLFWAVYALGLMIFLLFFFGQYLLAWVETQIGETSVPVLGLRESPARILNFLRNQLKLDGRMPEMYQNLFWYQGYIVMVVSPWPARWWWATTSSTAVCRSTSPSRCRVGIPGGAQLWACSSISDDVGCLVLFVLRAVDRVGLFRDHLHLAGGIVAYGAVLTCRSACCCWPPQRGCRPC